MQQAIYTNTHVAKPSTIPGLSAISGHGTGNCLESNETGSEFRRFRKLRLALSVLGNVVGGTVLLSGMLMLPQLLVSLLVS